jgi:hypothetical protein
MLSMGQARKHRPTHSVCPDCLQVFFTGNILVQCETPESRFYRALIIVVRNPGKEWYELLNREESVSH